MTQNVCRTCRHFGISQTIFYWWLHRYRDAGLTSLRDGPRGPRHHPFTTPPRIDEATRYRILKIYPHNSMKSATTFIEEVRRRLPVAIQRIQTDHGLEFGTDFTCRLRDLGISHRQIPRRSPESNGKVERRHRTDEEEFYPRG